MALPSPSPTCWPRRAGGASASCLQGPVSRCWTGSTTTHSAGIDTLGSGYVGYVHRSQLAAPVSASHRVAVRATHLYARADLKSPDLGSLSLGSRVTVTGTEGRYSQTPMGWIPSGHLIPVEALADDPVEVSARLLGTPYLWGGNSAFGIDCSGLVWLGCEMCGLRCPGDSDQQRQALGQDLPESAPLRRGDLVFWKGHVAWVADPQTILHANGHDMAVAYEPLDAAIARIAAAGDGPVTARKRLDPRSET
jgi:cell wall-associated NlpC family hydrolase